MLVRAPHTSFCARDRGCSVHPAFPAPSVVGGYFCHTPGASRRGNAVVCFHIAGTTSMEYGVIARSESDEAIHSFFARRNGLLRGACHRARIRATRWLAMTEWLFDGMGRLTDFAV